MAKDQKEWFKQADYDMGAAQTMFDGKRYIYAVFMCHLSIEKALKGLYHEKFNNQPPKTHNLWYLAEKIQLVFPEDLAEFIDTLNRLSVVTRYPDDLQKMSKTYNKVKTGMVMKKSEEVLRWLKEKQ